MPQLCPYQPLLTHFKAHEAMVIYALLSIGREKESNTFITTHKMLYETLHLTRSTYYRIINALTERGYINHRHLNMGACKTVRATRFWLKTLLFETLNINSQYA